MGTRFCPAQHRRPFPQGLPLLRSSPCPSTADPFVISRLRLLFRRSGGSDACRHGASGPAPTRGRESFRLWLATASLFDASWALPRSSPSGFLPNRRPAPLTGAGRISFSSPRSDGLPLFGFRPHAVLDEHVEVGAAV